MPIRSSSTNNTVECVACSSQFPMFPPTQTVTVLPVACPFLKTCVTPGISRHPHPEGESCTTTVFTNLFFSKSARLSRAPVGLFSRSRLRDTQGGRLYTTAQVPGVFCGACSGRSKIAKSSNHGVAFRKARAEQGHGNPACQLFCSIIA